MKKAAAIAHFKTATALARALRITKGAVSQWDKIVPEGSAYKLQVITGGKLRVDERLYSKASATETRLG
jgi:hypothetical protein